MSHDKAYERLLYRYELVRARLAIREHYVKTIVKDVYENIGQALSLVRVQLSLLNTEADKRATTGELVGDAIRDLRSMCRKFHPDQELMDFSDFVAALDQELTGLFPDASFKSVDPGKIAPEISADGKTVILFSMLLEILLWIQAQKKGNVASLEIQENTGSVELTIAYNGNIIRKSRGSRLPHTELSLFERAELLGGGMQIKKTSVTERRIKLVIPFNLSYGKNQSRTRRRSRIAAQRPGRPRHQPRI